METTFKDTKLGQIPEEWEVTTIDKILVNQRNAIVDGPFGSNMKNSDYVDSGVPVFQGKNITGNRFVWSDIRYISYEKAQELIRSKVIVGDILLIKIGSIGYSALIDTLYGFNYAIIPANLLKMSINEEVYSKAFLLQYLQDTKTVKRLQNAASQTAQPALSLTTVREFVIMMPPLPEQRKIAEILSTVDKVIEKTDAIIIETRQLKKGLMQKLFTEGIGHTRFKGTKIGKVPEEWEVVNLSNVFQVIDGDRGVNYPKSNEMFDDGYCVFLNAKNVTRSGFRFDEVQFITRKKDEILGKGKLARGDLVLTTRGTLGNFAFLNDEVTFENLRINSGMVVLRPLSNIVTDYYYQYFNSYLMQNQIERFSFGTAQSQLTVGGIQKFRLLLPSNDEQRKIAEILNEVDSKIKTEQAFKAELEQLKKGLMQVLLTGKARVKV